MIQVAKIIGRSLITKRSIAGTGVGIGIVFGSLIQGVSRNPSLRGFHNSSSSWAICASCSNKGVDFKMQPMCKRCSKCGYCEHYCRCIDGPTLSIVITVLIILISLGVLIYFDLFNLFSFASQVSAQAGAYAA